MAKYKLIKKFPGSASLGTVIDTDDVAFGITHNYTDYPEFWELVVEKDYEILNLNIDNSLVTCNNHGRWGNRKNIQECTLEWLLKEYPNSIHSVKRKDGEIFSVGDLITYRKRHGFGEWELNSFSLEDNEILAECTRISLWDTYPVKVSEPVTNLKKLIKKPILITEDGVEIFEGDECWACDKATLRDLGKVDWKNAHPFKEGLYFSTREAAEKYIEENKPIYSKKDMLSFGASMSPTLYPYQCEGCLKHWKRFKKRE